MTAARMVETDDLGSYPVEHEQGCAIVVASGEIDVHTAPRLRRALDLAATLSGRIVVDLTDVSLMDSAGLGVVLRAAGRGRLPLISLAHPPRALRLVLQLTGLGAILPVFLSRRDAIEGTEHADPV